MHKQKIILTSEFENLSKIILPFYYQIYFYKVNFSVQYNDNIENFKCMLTVKYSFLKEWIKLYVKH